MLSMLEGATFNVWSDNKALEKAKYKFKSYIIGAHQYNWYDQNIVCHTSLTVIQSINFTSTCPFKVDQP